jgi:hypothetical protein
MQGLIFHSQTCLLLCVSSRITLCEITNYLQNCGLRSPTAFSWDYFLTKINIISTINERSVRCGIPQFLPLYSWQQWFLPAPFALKVFLSDGKSNYQFPPQTHHAWWSKHEDWMLISLPATGVDVFVTSSVSSSKCPDNISNKSRPRNSESPPPPCSWPSGLINSEAESAPLHNPTSTLYCLVTDRVSKYPEK